jgi:signal peptidase II
VKRELRPYLILVCATILADQLSKYFIRHFMLPGESVQVLGDFFRFTFVYNRGGAFGTLLGNSLFYIIMAIAASIFIVMYLIKTDSKEKFAKIMLSLVVGGAIGNNLIDRVSFGQVVDFIDVDVPNITIPPFSIASFHFEGYQILRWFTFNIADAAITVGLIGFVIYLAVKEHTDKKIVAGGEPEMPSQIK